MKDFDAMEHLESMKLNHKPQNPLHTATLRVLSWFGLVAIGLTACAMFYGFVYAVLNS